MGHDMHITDEEMELCRELALKKRKQKIVDVYYFREEELDELCPRLF